MKRLLSVLMMALALFGCRQATQSPTSEPQPSSSDSTTTNAPSSDNSDSKMPDFILPDVNGKQVSLLADIANHDITIIDFWASWCGPCMREIPNLKEAYKKYKDKGLDIVGVSLDENEVQWKNAIQQMGMSWKHLSDLKGWDSEPVSQLGIDGIPFMVLVDNQGNILATGLRGQELLQFLEEKLTGKE